MGGSNDQNARLSSINTEIAYNSALLRLYNYQLNEGQNAMFGGELLNLIASISAHLDVLQNERNVLNSEVSQ